MNNKFIKILAFFLIISLLTAFFAVFPFGEAEDKGSHPSNDSTQASVTDFSSFAEKSDASYEGAPSVSAKSAILCTVGGEVLFERDADIVLPMASITKLMAAVVALENVTDLKKKINISPNAVGIEGSSVYLKAGECVDYEMLLYSAMLESANDATAALAIAVSGSVDSFVLKMNEKAKELSMENTVFKNPHGLPADGHFTTSRDYAKLMAYALQNEMLCEIIGTKKKVYPSSDGTLTRVLTNHNRLLNTYQGMIGGKTGFTKSSGRTLVTAAERDGTKLICVTINAPNDWNDHASLFDFGFECVKTEIFDSNTKPLTVELAGGIKESVKAEFKAFSLTVPRDLEIDADIILPYAVFAPAKKGDKIGRIICKSDGKVLYETDIFLSEDCLSSTEAEKDSNIIDKIIGFFKK